MSGSLCEFVSSRLQQSMIEDDVGGMEYKVSRRIRLLKLLNTV